jgi:hypothetical protein
MARKTKSTRVQFSEGNTIQAVMYGDDILLQGWKGNSKCGPEVSIPKGEWPRKTRKQQVMVGAIAGCDNWSNAKIAAAIQAVDQILMEDEEAVEAVEVVETVEELESTPTVEAVEAAPKAKKAKAARKPKTTPAPSTKLDLLMWIGSGNYTIESFIAEAEKQGVSKRIGKIPTTLALGETRVFLATDEGYKGDAVIFGYFIPQGIEQLVFDAEIAPQDPRAKPVTLSEAAEEEPRGCGQREDVGATYLVAYNPNALPGALLEASEGITLHGPLVVFHQFLDYNALIDDEALRFRSFKEIDGDALLGMGLFKTAPSARDGITAAPKIAPRTKTPWTPEDYEMLKDFAKSSTSVAEGIRRYAKMTGRSVRGVEYAWRMHVKPKDPIETEGADD